MDEDVGGLTTLGTDTRHEERETRHDRADARQLGRRRRAHHEARAVTEARCCHEPRHASMERFRREATPRIRGDDQVLELAGRGVRFG